MLGSGPVRFEYQRKCQPGRHYRSIRRHGDDVINYVGTHNITNCKEVNNLKHL
jgi:hypothetical protein